MSSTGFAPIVEGLKRNCLSPETLILKVGARVMFTKNHLEGKYVNGTLGEVVSFSKVSGQPIVETRFMVVDVSTSSSLQYCGCL